jgi:cellulose synthase (UDP-forming)
MEYPHTPSRTEFLDIKNNKMLLAATVGTAILYLFAVLFWFQHGNPILFWLFLIGEIFHLWQITTYAYTVWDTSYNPPLPILKSTPVVDIYITVAGEPLDVIEETARAAKNIDYPNFKIYLLNDGYVAKKDNWRDVELLAKSLGVFCITRKIPGGAKAGNVNFALKRTKGSLVAIFDADQVPHTDFLQKTVPYFTDPKLGFVQSPQYYKNAYVNMVAKGAWEQQELFFGPISRGKNRMNATFMCGTNMLIKKEAILEAGGMCETNIAEDFLTSLYIHSHGWKSLYVPEVLAEGLAPEDFISYYKQQFRWGRGSLEVVFKKNPLFIKGLSFPQKIQYLSSASFFLSGIVVAFNATLPLIFLFTGLIPLRISTMALASIFLPYMTLTIYTLQATSNFSFTFQALAFSMSSFTIHIKAIIAVLFNKKSGFDVTAKKAISGNFFRLVIPHLTYLALIAVGTGVALSREGVSSSLTSNMAWALFNIAVFLPFITSAIPALTPQMETPTITTEPFTRNIIVKRPTKEQPDFLPQSIS